jgi:hypothetical protein
MMGRVEGPQVRNWRNSLHRRVVLATQESRGLNAGGEGMLRCHPISQHARECISGVIGDFVFFDCSDIVLQTALLAQ